MCDPPAAACLAQSAEARALAGNGMVAGDSETKGTSFEDQFRQEGSKPDQAYNKRKPVRNLNEAFSV